MNDRYTGEFVKSRNGVHDCGTKKVLEFGRYVSRWTDLNMTKSERGAAGFESALPVLIHILIHMVVRISIRHWTTTRSTMEFDLS